MGLLHLGEPAGLPASEPTKQRNEPRAMTASATTSLRHRPGSREIARAGCPHVIPGARGRPHDGRLKAACLRAERAMAKRMTWTGCDAFPRRGDVVYGPRDRAWRRCRAI